MKIHPTSYNLVAKILHWVMAIIIIAAWFIGFYSANFLSYADLNSGKFGMVTLHKQIATTVMFLIVLRIVWRLTHATPDLPETMSPLVKLAAHLGHIALYILMIAVPISGWFFSSSAGYGAPVAGLFELPPLIEKSDDAELATFGAIHTYLTWALGLVVLGHVAMALKHQFIDKDGTLEKMTFTRR